ncbi:hypothetical protein [[Mycoplasma] mobile]|uniref:ATP synthase operon intergenic protein n=1 Tax=Mycoplasma mobile (strain ATCC 43663 / 163K / NCTC 11711) TaxID=267748 RepID=Q6KI80_MYCM1|nr:hypothetical protein [[Mycoplasma] mobile]AAT27696.1 ATP synthase operon intergenic protein [Mycoplasma mobile 163K]
MSFFEEIKMKMQIRKEKKKIEKMQKTLELLEKDSKVKSDK